MALKAQWIDALTGKIEFQPYVPKREERMRRSHAGWRGCGLRKGTPFHSYMMSAVLFAHDRRSEGAQMHVYECALSGCRLGLGRYALERMINCRSAADPSEPTLPSLANLELALDLKVDSGPGRSKVPGPIRSDRRETERAATDPHSRLAVPKCAVWPRQAQDTWSVPTRRASTRSLARSLLALTPPPPPPRSTLRSCTAGFPFPSLPFCACTTPNWNQRSHEYLPFLFAPFSRCCQLSDARTLRCCLRPGHHLHTAGRGDLRRRIVRAMVTSFRYTFHLVRSSLYHHRQLYIRRIAVKDRCERTGPHDNGRNPAKSRPRSDPDRRDGISSTVSYALGLVSPLHLHARPCASWPITAIAVEIAILGTLLLEQVSLGCHYLVDAGIEH